MKKIAFIFVAVFLVSSFSYSFVASLELLERHGKLILLIGDRHIDVSKATQDLKDIEKQNIGAVVGLLDWLDKQGENVNGIFEISSLDLRHPAGNLLHTVPQWIVGSKQSGKSKNLIPTLSDHRRDFIKNFFIDSPNYAKQIVGVLLPMLLKDFSFLLSAKDRQWIEDLNSGKIKPAGANDFFSFVERYLGSNAQFQAEFEKQFTKLGNQEPVATIGFLKKKFTDVNDELTAAMKPYASQSLETKLLKQEQDTIQKCVKELDTVLKTAGMNEKAGLAEVVLASAKKQKSLHVLDNSTLRTCALFTLSDVGFLVDALASQKQYGRTIVLAGRAHMGALSQKLKGFGYKTVFSEGEIRSAGRRGSLDKIVESETMVTIDVLKKRLQETAHRFSVKVTNRKHDEL